MGTLLATDKLIKNLLGDSTVNNGYGLILIQHLLPDTEIFLNILQKAGFQILKSLWHRIFN